MFPVWRPSPASWKVSLSLHFVTLTTLLIAWALYCRFARAVVVSSVVPKAVLTHDSLALLQSAQHRVVVHPRAWVRHHVV